MKTIVSSFILIFFCCTISASFFSLTEEDKNFWAQQACRLPWFSPWNQIFRADDSKIFWFEGGTLNASYVCLDAHNENNHRNAVAIHWSNERGNYKTFTYGQLYESVNKFAGYLINLGVKTGDIVILYLPMVPEVAIAMLACARIGAIHCVVFSGFSSQSLCDRIMDTQARFVITTDVAYYRGKELTLKSVVDQALTHKTSVQKVIIFKRLYTEIPLIAGRDCVYQELEKQQVYVKPVAVESNYPLFILYTSGTTGKPKGIVHGTGGYLTYVYATLGWAFDIKERDVYWCTADIGWITGHSYGVYGPLMYGATIVMREGAPDYPNARVWWQLIDRLKINVLYTSPTALRMFMRLGNDTLKDTHLNSLRMLGSVGEPLNPEVWHWYFDMIGHQKCPIIDTWWQTETGGFMIAPQMINLVPLKPGSVSKPMPGIGAMVVNKNGQQVSPNTKGYLVLTKPWPGMALGIYNNPTLFQQTYLSTFKNYFYTGDYAMQDEQGYFWLLGRADEVIKVSGHRIGTAELEHVVLEHYAVAENAAVGVHDDLKGQAIVIFVVLKKEYQRIKEFDNEITQLMRTKIGSFAAPRSLYYVEKLPKTRSGKIMRRLLKALLDGLTVGDISTLEDEASIEEIQQMMGYIKVNAKVYS